MSKPKPTPKPATKQAPTLAEVTILQKQNGGRIVMPDRKISGTDLARLLDAQGTKDLHYAYFDLEGIANELDGLEELLWAAAMACNESTFGPETWQLLASLVGDLSRRLKTASTDKAEIAGEYRVEINALAAKAA